jgi:hypothetical protein
MRRGLWQSAHHASSVRAAHCVRSRSDLGLAAPAVTYFIIAGSWAARRSLFGALARDEAVNGIDGDAVGLLEDRGEREAMAERVAFYVAVRVALSGPARQMLSCNKMSAYRAKPEVTDARPK